MLKNPDQKEFLSVVYEQCNEHMREQPRARDQVVLFYVAICAFYLSSVDFLSDFMFFCLSFAMLVLGLACSFVVIKFRSWIIQYVNSAEVIGKLLINEQEFSTEAEIVRFIQENCSTSQNPFFLRMGNVIILGFIFVTLAPFAAICDRFLPSCTTAVVLCLLCAALYFFFLVFLFYREVKKAETMGDKTWIIRFNTNKSSSKD